ncbi:MAG: hypothetical protein ACRELB_00735 [Polyangiaceae bacterium]
MRHTRGRALAWSVIAATVCGAGCTSLLGEFSLASGGGSDSGADTSSGGQDAGDGAATTKGDASDAATDGDATAADADAAAGPPVLTCNGYGLTNDLVVVTLGAGSASTFNNPLYVFHTSAGVIQILASQNGGDGYTLYAFQGNGGSPSVNSTTIAPPQPNDLLGAMQVSDGVLAWSLVGIGTAPGMSAGTTLIPPAFVSGNLASQTLIPASGLPSQEYTDLTLHVAEIAPGDFFDLLFFGNAFASPPTFTLFTGRTTNGDAGVPVPFAQGSTTQPSYLPTLLEDWTNAYAFMGTDPTVASTTIQSFPLVPDGGASTPRSLGSPSLGGNVLIAAAGPSAASASVFDIASAVVDLTTTTIHWRVGQVPASMMGTFTAADLVATGNAIGVNDIPFNGGSQQWVGDDALLIGKGPASSTPGFNFFWFDAQGNERVAAIANAAGTANGILADRTGTQQAAITVNQIVTPGLAKFDLVWTEQYPDGDGGFYQVLKYNVLVCSN